MIAIPFFFFFFIHFSIYIEIFQYCLYLLWTIGAHSVQEASQRPFSFPGPGSEPTQWQSQQVVSRDSNFCVTLVYTI